MTVAANIPKNITVPTCFLLSAPAPEANNIGIAYPGFSVWGSNVLTAVDWYDVSNATRGRIVSY